MERRKTSKRRCLLCRYILHKSRCTGRYWEQYRRHKCLCEWRKQSTWMREIWHGTCWRTTQRFPSMIWIMIIMICFIPSKLYWQRFLFVQGIAVTLTRGRYFITAFSLEDFQLVHVLERSANVLLVEMKDAVHLSLRVYLSRLGLIN